MLDSLAWLGLESKDLDRARTFYAEHLDLPVREATGSSIAFAAGDVDFVVRRPTDVPRGGVHTHYAFSIPKAEYDDWWDRLEDRFDLEEHRFGSVRSLYLYDPDGHCVELGQRDVAGPGIDGIFEIVLEVTHLEPAEAFYRDLGFSVMDRGDDRRRVRLSGPVALELWEPQLGLANARGGVHVDVGFTTSDPDAAVDAVAERVQSVESVDGGRRFRDPDGHVVTLRGPDS